MSLPSQVTLNNLDGTGDDPEQSLLVDCYNIGVALNALIAHLGGSPITSIPPSVGGGLEVAANALKVKLAGTPSLMTSGDGLAIQIPVAAKTAGFTVTAAERGQHFACSGTFTVAFTAAATLTNGFFFWLDNAGAGTVTLDPNGSELIDGATTLALAPGQSVLVVCDGTGFTTLGRGLPAASLAQMQAAASMAVAATPGNLKGHPGVAKAWVAYNSAGVPAILASHNVLSLTAGGTGVTTITLDEDMDGADYVVVGMSDQSINLTITNATVLAAGSLTIRTQHFEGSALEPTLVMLVVFGNHP